MRCADAVIRLPRGLWGVGRIAQVLRQLASEDALSDSLLQLPEERGEILLCLRVPDQRIEGGTPKLRGLPDLNHLPS